MFDYQPTPLDIRFRLFGFLVTVSPWFWLIMALLGDWTFQDREIGAGGLVVWVACGFVAILVHELGHATFIRLFRSPTEIVLIAFGGYATIPYPPHEAWKRLVIAAAGPAFGLALCGLVVVSAMATGWPDYSAYLDRAFFYLFVQTLFWNLFNLLPIWPLDGGRICRELLTIARVRTAEKTSLMISLVTAGGLTVYGLAKMMRVPVPVLDEVMPFRPGTFMTLWMAMFAYQSYVLLQAVSRRDRYWDDDDREPWRR